MKPLNVSSESEQGMQWAHAQISQMAAAGRLDQALSRKTGHTADGARRTAAAGAKTSVRETKLSLAG
ncbi:hypothetical protein [Pseudomonas sp. LS-2]|uniref:hypothetical protein n=1 Tax=Pseudomonas sp. LS-2 TaxID=2315859 RepID=UPI001058F8B9|nr:hypothetical protein [Pseudomonas sp. LS-2]